MSHNHELAKLQKAVEQNPSTPKFYNDLGSAYLDLGRYEEAISAYTKAFKLDPQNAYIQNSLGNVYRQLGQFTKAISAYEKAIELNSQFAYPYHNMGNVYAHLGHHEEAIMANQKAIKLDSEMGVAYVVILSSQRHLGHKLNEEYLAKARDLIPEDSYYNRACLESIAGNVEIALELLKKVSQGGRDLAKTDPDFEFIRDDPRFQAWVDLNDNS